MTTCTNVLFPKQLFQKRTKAYLGIHVTHSCMYSKEVLCAGDCARACASRRWVGSGHRTSSTGRKLWHAGPILSNPPQHHRPGPWPWGGSLSSACSSPSSDKNSASVHSIAVWHLQQTVHSKLAYIGVVTSLAGVFNLESLGPIHQALTPILHPYFIIYNKNLRNIHRIYSLYLHYIYDLIDESDCV